MKEYKEILLTYKKEKFPIVFSVSFTMDFSKDMSLREYKKEWKEAVEILKGARVK